MTRRVVTGLNAEGKSCVLIDGPLVPLSGSGGMAWRTDSVPADNSGTADIAPVPFSMDLMHGGGTTFMVVDFPPGMPPHMHATDTLDYIVVLRGEVVIELEEGEARCGAGDCIVDRGVIHSWRNDGPDTATIASITLPALPVGNGRTA